MGAVFSLWRAKPRAFPETVGLGGREVPVDACFRTALKILKLLGDEEVPAPRKVKMMLGWFYAGALDAALSDPQGAVEALVGFLAPGKWGGDGAGGALPGKRGQNAPRYCFEFDAGEIYASFLQEYGIDLSEAGDMHWYKFLILFANLGGECAFGRKMELRAMDLKDYRGKQRARLMKAQKAAQVPAKLSAGETEMMNDVLRKLMG